MIDTPKICVYGAKTEGKFYPATKGTVESPDPKKDERPKVTVVGKKGWCDQPPERFR